MLRCYVSEPLWFGKNFEFTVWENKQTKPKNTYIESTCFTDSKAD